MSQAHAHALRPNHRPALDAAGFCVATVPELRGCHTRARSLDKLMERVRKPIELCLEAGGERVIVDGVHRCTARGGLSMARLPRLRCREFLAALSENPSVSSVTSCKKSVFIGGWNSVKTED